MATQQQIQTFAALAASPDIEAVLRVLADDHGYDIDALTEASRLLVACYSPLVCEPPPDHDTIALYLTGLPEGIIWLDEVESAIARAAIGESVRSYMQGALVMARYIIPHLRLGPASRRNRLLDGSAPQISLPETDQAESSPDAPPGSLVKFARARLEAVKGDAVTFGALYFDYESWCEKNQYQSLGRAHFDTAWPDLCDKVGFRYTVEEGRGMCFDLRLAD